MEDRLPRKLAAILYAYVAGYSRLSGEDSALVPASDPLVSVPTLNRG